MDKHEYEELIFLRKIVDSLPGHIYWKDLEGRYLGCNQRQADALQIGRAEYIKGKTDYDLPWAEKAKALQDIDKSVIRKLKKSVAEEEVKVPGYEKERTFLSEKMPLYDEAGFVKGILGVSLDITDLKEAQARADKALAFAEEAERRRKQFLSNQEHDINTALTGIIYAGMMFQSLDDIEDLQEGGLALIISAIFSKITTRFYPAINLIKALDNKQMKIKVAALALHCRKKKPKRWVENCILSGVRLGLAVSLF